MEFPFGRHHTHHHHHHQRNDEDQEDEQRPPPPPNYSAPPPPCYLENQFGAPPPPRFPPGPPPPGYYQETEFAPPPPRPTPPAYYQEPEYPPPSSGHVSHVHHSSTDPEFNSSVNYQHPPTVASHLSHVSHEVKVDDQFAPAPQTETTHQFFKPHMPSFLHHHSSSGAGSALSGLSNKPTVRVFCKADPNLSLTIRDNKVILATSDPSDEFQHWYKDEKFSTRVKDEESFPSFALVNKATGQAMKHSVGDTQPVQLIRYNPDVLDESVLWTESRDTGDGYKAVRMVNNIRLNVDAFHGDKKSGGVHDGTTIVLWQWKKGDNQKWRIIPY